jgi:hypothetical protein
MQERVNGYKDHCQLLPLFIQYQSNFSVVMLGAQTTATTTTTTTTTCTSCATNMHNEYEQLSNSPSHRCSTCHVSLGSVTDLQRHTDEPWQYVETTSPCNVNINEIDSLYNVKRRIASMPPNSQETFNHKLHSQFEVIEESSSGDTSDDEEPERFEFRDDCEDTEDDEEERDVDLKIRTNALSHAEMQLPSGKWVESRFTERKRRVKRDQEKMKTAATPSNSADRTVSLTAQQALDLGTYLRAEQARERRVLCRDDMGLLGITVHQHRALLCAEKRARTQEAIALRANEWAVAKWANVQKYDRAHHRSQSKSKGAKHNLLPR